MTNPTTLSAEEVEGLIERLNKMRDVFRVVDQKMYQSCIPMQFGQSAAAKDADTAAIAAQALSQLQVERDRTAAVLEDLTAKHLRDNSAVAQLEEQLAAAKEALRPFKEACEAADDEDAAGNEAIWESPLAMSITFGDVRRAALAAGEGK